jgi:hypothetical protein
MKNKDQILLEEMYFKTTKKNVLNEETTNDDSVFYDNVPLDLELDYGTGGSFIDITDKPKDVLVKYRIDVQYGRSGIYGISTAYVNAAPFSIEVTDYDDNDNEIVSRIDVDLKGLNVETELNVTRSGQIIPSSITIKLNKDMQPYYGLLKF